MSVPLVDTNSCAFGRPGQPPSLGPPAPNGRARLNTAPLRTHSAASITFCGVTRFQAPSGLRHPSDPSSTSGARLVRVRGLPKGSETALGGRRLQRRHRCRARDAFGQWLIATYARGSGYARLRGDTVDLLLDRDRLPRALTYRVAYLFLVLRCDVWLQDSQHVVVAEVEDLRDDAHADPVAFAETPIDVDLHDGLLNAAPAPACSATPRRFACGRAGARPSSLL